MKRSHVIQFRVSDAELAEVERRRGDMRRMFDGAVNVTQSDAVRSMMLETRTPPLHAVDLHTLGAEVNSALWGLEAAGRMEFNGDTRVKVLRALTAAQEFVWEQQRQEFGIEVQDIVPGTVTGRRGQTTLHSLGGEE